MTNICMPVAKFLRNLNMKQKLIPAYSYSLKMNETHVRYDMSIFCNQKLQFPA